MLLKYILIQPIQYNLSTTIKAINYVTELRIPRRLYWLMSTINKTTTLNGISIFYFKRFSCASGFTFLV